MKKTLILLASACLALTACNKDEIKRLQDQNDSLRTVNDVKDNNMTLLAETMADLQNNINTIKEKEGIINVQLAEGSTQSQIQSDLDAIEKALNDNKQKVANLQAQLSKATKNNKELQAIISTLNAQITAQNEEIEKLKTSLSEKDIEIGFLNNAVIKLSTSVDSLATTKAQVDSQLAQATDELQEGYYIMNTKSYLKENGLLETGLFKGKKVTGDFNDKLFTKVNITEFAELPLDTKKAEIVSTHPASSYRLEKDAEGLLTLVISDKEAFWNTSKYLVIITK